MKSVFDQLLSEKDNEIKELKDWNSWFSMWHENFKKQIENLTTELETYRPTKLHGNGQCECYKCKQEGRPAINWTDWCSKYKGHIYCDDCLKEILKEEQSEQIQFINEVFEKIRNKLFPYFTEKKNYYTVVEVLQNLQEEFMHGNY